MAFSGLANESARLTYTTPLRWIFQRRTRALPEGDARGSSRRIIVTGAHYSNLPRSIYLSFTSRERMWAAWRCRRLEIPRHALFTVSYWNCTRGTPRCLREEMETHFISRLGDSPSKPRHVTDGLVSTYKSTWRFAGRYRKASVRERTQNLTSVESNTNHHNSIYCVIYRCIMIYLFCHSCTFYFRRKYVPVNRNLK